MSAEQMKDKLILLVDNLPQSALWDMELVHEIMRAAADIGRHIRAGTVPDEKAIFGGRIARYLEVNAACRMPVSIGG